MSTIKIENQNPKPHRRRRPVRPRPDRLVVEDHCFICREEDFNTMEDIIKLNVGGRIFVTRRQTLCAEPDSLLGRMFDPDSKFAKPAEIDGCVFFDRDPDMFGYILSYLRGSFDFYPELSKLNLWMLKGEADYYSIGALVKKIDESLLTTRGVACPHSSQVSGDVRLDNTWGGLSALKPGQWRCEACRTLNRPEDTRRCCACEEDKPGAEDTRRRR